MEIKGLVDYEFLFDLELRNPHTDEPLGIKMKIRSAGSEPSKAILRKHTDKNLERRIKGRMPKADQMELEELERVASYIHSWDWGDNTYKGEIPVFSMKKAVSILEEVGWIFGQVKEAAENVTNFSPPSETSSAATSM
jgi:hypothetical protein